VVLQVKYGWTPSANLGPQLTPAAERGSAATLADWADRIDHAAAYGADALYAPDSHSKARAPRTRSSLTPMHALLHCVPCDAINPSSLCACPRYLSHAHCAQPAGSPNDRLHPCMLVAAENSLELILIACTQRLAAVLAKASKRSSACVVQDDARRAQQTAARLIDDIGWSSPPVWPGLSHSIGFATPAAAAAPLSPAALSPAPLQRPSSSSNSRGARPDFLAVPPCMQCFLVLTRDCPRLCCPACLVPNPGLTSMCCCTFAVRRAPGGSSRASTAARRELTQRQRMGGGCSGRRPGPALAVAPRGERLRVAGPLPVGLRRRIAIPRCPCSP
jgi:hypothetical protein